MPSSALFDPKESALLHSKPSKQPVAEVVAVVAELQHPLAVVEVVEALLTYSQVRFQRPEVEAGPEECC